MESLYPPSRYLDASSTLQPRRGLDARLDAASTARRQGSGTSLELDSIALARLLEAVLEAAHAYGGKVIVYMKNRVSFPLTYRGIEPQDKKKKPLALRLAVLAFLRGAFCPFIT